MDDFNKKTEENLLEMKKQKEEADKRLLQLEWVIGFISCITFLVLIYVASYIPMPTITIVSLVIFASVVFGVGMFYALKIEQVAGYYECAKCHHKYIPTYKSVFFAMHIGRTRYMKCPKCNKRSWNKKRLTK